MMTWFGWLMICVYAISSSVQVSKHAKAGRSQGALVAMLIPALLVIGILAVGTGNGI